MSWLAPATPEEKAAPGWEQRRNDEWYRRRNTYWWHRVAKKCGYHRGRMGRGEHAPPTIDGEDEED